MINHEQQRRIAGAEDGPFFVMKTAYRASGKTSLVFQQDPRMFRIAFRRQRHETNHADKLLCSALLFRSRNDRLDHSTLDGSFRQKCRSALDGSFRRDCDSVLWNRRNTVDGARMLTGREKCWMAWVRQGPLERKKNLDLVFYSRVSTHSSPPERAQWQHVNYLGSRWFT